MKNSGIDWLGNIPYGWKKIRCKFLARTYTGNSIKDEEKELYTDCENSVPYIATKDISLGNNQINKSDILYIKNEDTNFVRAEKGDILLCVEGGSAGKKKTYLQEDVCFVNKLCCFHSFGINSAFLFYTMQSPHYEAEFFFNMSGLIGGVSRSKLDNFTIPAPTREEQESIVRILNDKVKKIDKLIEVQQAQIEKLKEYKQSVITEAVTKGLDPTVPMKDSGVEWIGKIPEDWEIQRAKYVSTSLVKGNGITKEDIVIGGDTPCVRYGEIYTKYNISFNVCQTRTNKEKLATLQFFHHGDILFACTGELVEEIGKNVVYLGDQDCLAGGDIIVMSHDQCPSFLNYSLYANCSQVQKSRGKAKLKVVHISASEIGNILVALPNKELQQQIADYLDDKCAKIDKLIALKQSKIDKLQEYKKSLIYEYVTGKKEVM